jgi:hypothetical protein
MEKTEERGRGEGERRGGEERGRGEGEERDSVRKVTQICKMFTSRLFLCFNSLVWYPLLLC